jgi:hypothetical protein
LPPTFHQRHDPTPCGADLDSAQDGKSIAWTILAHQ